jgi:hypothetical protein
MGIPCYHTVAKRLTNPGYILPEDIHPFWFYKRPKAYTQSDVAAQNPTVVLNPAIIRGKGRPRGSKNKEKNHRITSTRRDLSAFELPSSSAPAVLSRQPTESQAVLNLLEDNIEELTTTQIGIQRMENRPDT